MIAGDIVAGDIVEVVVSATTPVFQIVSTRVPHYTTGTFTPTLLFGGAAVSMTGTFTGRYTRIGNRCFFDIRIKLTAKGSSSGSATIGALPFTINGSSGNFPVACKADLVNVDVAGGFYTVAPILNPGAASILLHEQGDNVSSVALTEADFQDTSSVRLSGHFEI